MTTHYETLGIAKNATPDEIKRAYRKLASQHHPDKGGDTAKFQSIQTAYDTLSNPQKRAEYDNPRPQGHPHGFQFRSDGPFDFETIFNMFGTRFQPPGQQQRHQQARMELWVTLMDVALGGRRTVSVGTSQGVNAVEIEIPLGIEDGSTVQYPRIGPNGMDVLITYRIHPHPSWQRQGLDLFCEYTVSFWDLILGGDIRIKDIVGNELLVTVQPNTQPGTQLRVRGRGLRAKTGLTGNLFIKIQGKLPDSISPELMDMIKQTREQ